MLKRWLGFVLIICLTACGQMIADQPDEFEGEALEPLITEEMLDNRGS
ncbi:MAG: hypothetical protein R2865_14645 [Deinococcales bacterium]